MTTSPLARSATSRPTNCSRTIEAMASLDELRDAEAITHRTSDRFSRRCKSRLGRSPPSVARQRGRAAARGPPGRRGGRSTNAARFSSARRGSAQLESDRLDLGDVVDRRRVAGRSRSGIPG